MKFVKDQIARQFSRAAVTYDLAAQLQQDMAADMLLQIPAERTGTFVDLGCGTGWALNRAAQLKRFELIAVDIAPGMIEVAQSRVPSAEFHCCDLESTTLANESADIVFSNAAVQWCELIDALTEIKRICKPDGLILISSFGPDTMHEVRSAWRESGDDSPRVHKFEPVETLAQTMRELNLAKVEFESMNRKLEFDSVDDLLQNIKQLGATNASTTRQTGLLGTKRYREFRKVLEKRLVAEGSLGLTFECVFATANKLAAN